MNVSAFWAVIEALEEAGLAVETYYVCEGTPEQVRDNPAGTMILIHPGITLDLPDVLDIQREALPAGKIARDGFWATEGLYPEDVLPRLSGREMPDEDETVPDESVYTYLFVCQGEEEDDDE